MTPGRRRFLSIMAGCALSTGIGRASLVEPVVWQGRALGASAEIRLLGEDRQAATRALNAALDTTRRLEGLFSLYQAGSALNRLNAAGHLKMPPEFARLMGEVEKVHWRSEGLYDPTVQPLMTALARSKDALTLQELESLAACIGWDKVLRSPTSLRFSAPNMAMTLNGIAQGFATDRVTEVLRAQGFDPFLVHLGEFRAGEKNARIAIAGSNNSVVETLDLRNAAVATSAPFGTRFENGSGHILRPDLKPFEPRWRSVTVKAETATKADGFSTALALTSTPDLAAHLVAARVLQNVWLEDRDGSLIRI